MDQKMLNQIKKQKLQIPFPMGLSKDGELITKDLHQIKHILISGSTGTGKTTFLQTFMYTIASTMHPKDILLLCIDTKIAGGYEIYNKSKLLLQKVIYSDDQILKSIKWCEKEMNTRLKNHSDKPFIVIIIEDLAGLMLSDKRRVYESLLYKLSKKGSVAGIHLILSTSRPTEKVLTNELKSVIQGRIAFRLANSTDSKQIIDVEGAEELKGNGDLLFRENDKVELINVQGIYTSLKDFDLLQDRINCF